MPHTIHRNRNVAHCLKRKTKVNILTVEGQRLTVTRGQLPPTSPQRGTSPVRVMLIVDPARGRGLCHGTEPAEAAK